jgi:hypothetical protein
MIFLKREKGAHGHATVIIEIISGPVPRPQEKEKG